MIVVFCAKVQINRNQICPIRSSLDPSESNSAYYIILSQLLLKAMFLMGFKKILYSGFLGKFFLFALQMYTSPLRVKMNRYCSEFTHRSMTLEVFSDFTAICIDPF